MSSERSNADDSKTDPIPPGQRIFEMIWPGALAAQAIYCAARYRIADFLSNGPLQVDEIAAATKTHAPALRRLLRALCSLEILKETSAGQFELTQLGETLKSDDPSGVHPWAVMLGAPFIWRPWGRMLKTIRTGEPAFPDMYGHSMYEFLADHPDEAEIYNSAMNAGASMMVSAIVEHYDFDQFDTIVDLGGGRGSLLQGILAAYPKPRGILFDLPAVAQTADELKKSDVAERCEIIGGDFFESVPSGADAYLLKGIIHGFNDENAAKILRNIKLAMRPDGKILICDVVLSEQNESIPQKAMMDLMMLALVEGRERTEAEFRSLLASAGFSLQQVIDTERGGSIVEGALAN